MTTPTSSGFILARLNLCTQNGSFQQITLASVGNFLFSVWARVRWSDFMLVLLVVLSLCLPLATEAITWKVCGTVGCDFSSISSAVGSAATGDTIEIFPGTYTEPAFINISAGVDLAFTANSGDVTIIATTSYYHTWLYIFGTVSLNGSFILPGSSIVSEGTLNQYGSLTMTSYYRAIYVYGTGQFNQFGIMNITTSSLNYYGVQIYNGVWVQKGEVWITVSSAATGVQFEVAGTSEWQQHANVWMQVDQATGVNLQLNGSWVQNADFRLVANGGSTGISISQGGQWLTQSGNTTLTMNGQDNTGISSSGFWKQVGNVYLSSSGGANIVGIELKDPADWKQQGSLSIMIPSDNADGVLFKSLSAKWNQQANIFLSVNGSESCGVNFTEGNPSQWRQSGFQPNLVVFGQDSHALCPPPLPAPSDEPIQANFSTSTPTVVVSKAASNNTQKGNVQYKFLSLQEVEPNGEIVQQVSLQNATWHGGSSNSSIVSSNFTSVLPNSAILEYDFLLASNATIMLANNFSLAVDSRFLKFSIRLSFWNWTATTNQLRINIGVTPAFNNSEQRINTPGPDRTTLFMQSVNPTQASALVELLDFGFAGAENILIPCYVGVDANSSSFSITFDYFGNVSLYYDPGLSLLLGQTGTSGSGDGGGSNTTLIVVISVVVPVAILVVILVVAAGLILLFVRRYLRARAIRSSGAVNFDPERPDSGEF